jgi:hypothetical protein
MTQDEILKELRIVIAENQQFTTWTISTPHLVELVNRAVKAEREACALICERIYKRMCPEAQENEVGIEAETIRARGKA